MYFKLSIITNRGNIWNLEFSMYMYLYGKNKSILGVCNGGQTFFSLLFSYKNEHNNNTIFYNDSCNSKKKRKHLNCYSFVIHTV